MSTTTIKLPADHDYLASLPDATADTLTVRGDGVAVLTERTGKVVLDGSYVAVNEFVSGFFSVSAFYPHDVALDGTPSMMCDRLTVAQRREVTGGSVPDSISVNGARRFILRVSGVGSLSEAKAWLAANPVTVYYALATTTIRYSSDNGTTWSTTDPAAGQSAIPLRKGTNSIWCTDRLSPEVALDYVQDTNKVINELRAAIVASGATS